MPSLYTEISINILYQITSMGKLCRHYVDSLCQYTTGVSHAASLCKRMAFRQRRAASHWSDSVIHLAHALTDVANWPRVQAATQVTLLCTKLACICSSRCDPADLISCYGSTLACRDVSQRVDVTADDVDICGRCHQPLNTAPAAPGAATGAGRARGRGTGS